MGLGNRIQIISIKINFTEARTKSFWLHFFNSKKVPKLSHTPRKSNHKSRIHPAFLIGSYEEEGFEGSERKRAGELSVRSSQVPESSAFVSLWRDRKRGKIPLSLFLYLFKLRKQAESVARI
jgi:hypothetical protein